MPTPSTDAPRATAAPALTPSATPATRRVRSVALRAAVGTLALSTVLTVGGVGDPPPAEAAGGSCTGWTSKIVPPRTIRVLRTNSGRVETVGFRRYVGEVMASGEWPARLHPTTLEVGAVATKQYAWYYALKGHHRPGYSRGGRCYDVRDDTMDQLYRPERARPTKRQLQAIEATWGLTLRKKGRFFLTGYRYGTVRGCAADANGWKIFERSVETCARKGWSRARVQRAYLGPKLTFVWSSQTAPVIHTPNVWLRGTSALPFPTATVSWRVASGADKVRRFRVQRRIGKGDWRRVDLGSRSARRADAWIRPGSAVRFRVRAIDVKGKRGPWAYSARRMASLRGDRDLSLGAEASAAGATRRSATLRFRGRSVALMARTGPGMGTVQIRIDGRRVATVDLSRRAEASRRIVWSRNFDRSKRRRITLVSATGRAELAGVLVLR